MRIGIITLFPQMFEALRCGGVTGRALQRGLVKMELWNPRDFTTDKHRRVDDRPYGGGPGMVMQVQPLRTAIDTAKQALGNDTYVIYLSPQGRPFTQMDVSQLLSHTQLLLIAGRYEGIDERVIERDIDAEWSIGDYVLSGGELAAMVMIDVLTRQLPGVLGDEESAALDSFSAGLLDYPHYTRPEEIDGQAVPAVLLKGNHAEIAQWRLKQALGRTWLKRPDLLTHYALTSVQKQLLTEFMAEQASDSSIF